MTESSSNSNSWPPPFDPMMMSSFGAAYNNPSAGGLMDPANFALYQRFFQPPRPLDLLTYHAAALHQHLAMAAVANRSLNVPFSVPTSTTSGTPTITKNSSGLGYSVADLLSENQTDKSDRAPSPDQSGKF